MRRIVQISAMAAAVAALSGCYTQLATVKAPAAQPAEEAPCPDSLKDSCAQARAQAQRDTVVIRDDTRKVCYWSRNWWGVPELRCYRTYYGGDWLSYYNDPWWYGRSDSYAEYGYGRCPMYYYYDPYTGYCRYYNDYDHYYYHSRPAPGRSPGGPQPPRRPRPSLPADNVSPPNSSPPPRPGEIRELPPYNPGGSSRHAPDAALPPAQRAEPRVRSAVTPSESLPESGPQKVNAPVPGTPPSSDGVNSSAPQVDRRTERPPVQQEKAATPSGGTPEPEKAKQEGPNRRPRRRSIE